ncbi:hypothetical protein UFOVP585_28 [uncultured Caudovirales phage]|uniref:Uncharacterized protein n=1 Tax=uncultured Caudovirales phage TaxID=2100421 RepID=A0A6J5N2V3_9CAUD|nr:hypothetical protein UFOVP585_28 [uncultured Caudovirales phage]
MINIPLPRLEKPSNACCNTYISNRGGKSKAPRLSSRAVVANRLEYIFDANTRKVGEHPNIGGYTL